ncbi:MAG TPA: hypothetical protein VLJ58_15390, partial [Ramlibacter sp.]|nr:hypothetical protein [Ramlibacter sp.]
PQQRAEAAAYWKALSARPEEILHDAQRMQALEGDLRGLREAVIKNTSAVSELRAQLGQARDERYSNPVVYVLALLLLAALALAAWTRRGRGAGPRDNDDWWRNAVEEAKAGAPRPAHSRPAEAEAPAARYEPQMSMPVPLEPRAAASVSQFRSSRSELTEFHQSQPGSLRATKAEEVHDVQQQADFFTSLGEHERAIEVLRSHINLHPETSPVAWLDLLAIYHRLHLREDYEATRAEFGQVFNAQAPHFDAYRLQVQSNGLESYPEALERITALWTSPKVLDLLETAIFRRPGEEGGHPFGLEAYRELLLLHSIAKEIAESEDNVAGFASSSGFTDFDRTQIQPLSARAPPPQQRNTALSSFPSLGKQGLDIDKGLDIDIDIDQLAPPDDFLQIIGAERELDSDGPTLLDFKLPEMDEATSEFDRRPPKPPRAAG